VPGYECGAHDYPVRSVRGRIYGRGVARPDFLRSIVEFQRCFPGGRRAGLGRTAACRLLPVTDTETDELIDSAEGVSTLLDGFRGSAVLDRKALRELMLRFALLLRELPQVVETDLNPVRCMTSGCVVLDMRVRIEPPRPVERVQTW
jgi:hypothetical protein